MVLSPGTKAIRPSKRLTIILALRNVYNLLQLPLPYSFYGNLATILTERDAAGGPAVGFEAGN
jgi:hypothetical protein